LAARPAISTLTKEDAVTIIAVFALAVLLPSPPRDIQTEQSKILKSCPVLTDAEAAAVLGAGTIFASAAETTAGTVRISLLCEFVQGERTLTVTASKTLGDKNAWEMGRKLSNGAAEPGLGDYAYSDVEDGKPHFLVVKGPLTLELRVGGKGATAVDLPKLREAAKKAVAKL
jgi:hypothetical protein